MPGSFAGPFASSVGLGLAGRATLPGVVSEVPVPTLPRVSLDVPVVAPGAVAEPEALPAVEEEVSLFEEELSLFVDPEALGLVFVSSAGGVSDGVAVRCIVLESLRPCALAFLCFFAFLPCVAVEPETESVSLPCADIPLAVSFELSFPTPVAVDAPPRLGTALDDVSRFEELSGCVCDDFLSLSALGVGFAARLLLGSELLLDEAFDELPGRALLFWSAGSEAVPLSSVVWLFGVVVVLRLSLVPVPVLVCARAPKAESTRASAEVTMILIQSLLWP
jgi:hypothetical protein